MKLASKVGATLMLGTLVALGGAQAASAADFSGVVGCSSSGDYWTCHDQNGNKWYTDNPDWRPSSIAN